MAETSDHDEGRQLVSRRKFLRGAATAAGAGAAAVAGIAAAQQWKPEGQARLVVQDPAIFRKIRRMRLRELNPIFIRDISSVAIRDIVDDLMGSGRIEEILRHIITGAYCDVHSDGPGHNDQKHDEEDSDWYSKSHCQWDEAADKAQFQDGFLKFVWELGSVPKSEAIKLAQEAKLRRSRPAERLPLP